MKTKQHLSIICMMLLVSSCKDCKQCKTYTQYETAPVILEYFGNYKPGNYWIYENQDGKKRDSMWVSDYVEGLGGDDFMCFKYAKIDFAINSSYLLDKRKLNVEIGNFSGKNNQSEVFITNSGGSNITIAKGIGGDLVMSNSIKYNYTVKTLKYSKIAILDNSIINIYASNIGIVTFLSSDKRDTFSLVKYSIK
jgi:hypothetical protein